jgi:hypothetical protein
LSTGLFAWFCCFALLQATLSNVACKRANYALWVCIAFLSL